MPSEPTHPPLAPRTHPTEAGPIRASHRAGVWPLVSASEMQGLDRTTISEQGIPGEVLMESAGRALIESTLELRATSANPTAPVVSLCGAGNNGGDGFVLARHLHAEGVAVLALLLGDPERLPADAQSQWQRLAATGTPHRVLEAGEAVIDGLRPASVVIDALFGTGLSRPLSERAVEAVSALDTLSTEGIRILSVDLPSGIDADTGQVWGRAVRADRTISISLPKIGLALEPGRSHAGDVRIARIGIADPVPERVARVELWNRRAAASRFPERPRSGHKGRFGHVLVLGGAEGKTGAAALCARAAGRAGAGLVTVACPAPVASIVEGLCVEAMTVGLPSSESQGFADGAEKAGVELAMARDVVALGPGIGREPGTVSRVRAWCAAIERPMVIDADGLNGLAGALECLHERSCATVLTPHPGEAARLLETDAADVNSDRVGAAREIAARSHAVVVLKGAATVIADPAGRCLVNPTGGPALGTGGTGDVLTGIVAALLAAGLDPFEAGGLAAWWHGAAADQLDRGLGFGVLAGEVADALPQTAQRMATDAEREESREGLELRFPGT